MIGTLPMRSLAPLDYRYALDAALAVLGYVPPLVRCDIPDLIDEILQRCPERVQQPAAGLWVEPSGESWPQVLRSFADHLAPGAPLAVIASQPLARLIPERRAWIGQPLGLRWRGMIALRRGLQQAGFTISQTYGIHTLSSIGYNLLAAHINRLGRPDLADRIGFAARLRYCSSSSVASFATVALLVARKEAR